MAGGWGHGGCRKGGGMDIKAGGAGAWRLWGGGTRGRGEREPGG